MFVARLLTAGLVFVLLATACEGDSGDPGATATATGTPATGTPEPTDTATATATPTATSSPVRRTGIAEIDRVIEAVEQRDVATLTGLVSLQSVACVATQDGIGGPPLCEAGEAEGDVVEVFPVAYCEGVLDRFPGAVLGQFAAQSRGLYAVTGVPERERDVPYWPVGDTYVVFHLDLAFGTFGGRLVIEDGAIVMAWFGCGAAPADVAASPVIAGPFEEPEAPPEVALPATGVAGVDAVIADVAAYNLGGLIERTALGEQACVDAVEGIGEVECNAEKGEVEGDLVAVLPVAHCEGSLSRGVAGTERALLSLAPRLYGVAEAPADEPDRPVWRRGDYFIVYELHAENGVPAAARLVVDRGGQVLVIWYGCGATADDLMRWGERELPVVLPPTTSTITQPSSIQREAASQAAHAESRSGSRHV